MRTVDFKRLFLLVLQELLKKCHQCMETIVKAKDQQAAEANKNASILLKELDLEKVLLKCDPVTWGAMFKSQSAADEG